MNARWRAAVSGSRRADACTSELDEGADLREQAHVTPDTPDTTDALPLPQDRVRGRLNER